LLINKSKTIWFLIICNSYSKIMPLVVPKKNVHL
jgi:hypothetical protein